MTKTGDLDKPISTKLIEYPRTRKSIKAETESDRVQEGPRLKIAKGCALEIPGKRMIGIAKRLCDLATWRETQSLSPLTMRVMPSLISATLKLISKPRRLSANRR